MTGAATMEEAARRVAFLIALDFFDEWGAAFWACCCI